jgi:hypothetical protein
MAAGAPASSAGGRWSHAPQFPATLSLPWVLAEHALAEASAAARRNAGVVDGAAGERLADVLLLPFAVHADAAAAALRLPSPAGSTAGTCTRPLFSST